MSAPNSSSECLVQLYYMKKLTLMLENLWNGMNKIEGRFVVFKSKNGKPTNTDELLKQINAYATVLRQEIPNEQYEEWEYCDYEVYTDENHHRSFWNEIPNDIATSYFFNIFKEITNTEYHKNRCFELSLYDFNDDSVYFDTEEELNKFVEEHDCAPCTAFELDGTSAIEMWSA